MQFPFHALIGLAANIPITPPTATLSFSPVVLTVPDRPVPDLQLRISAPATGRNLPIVLLSHGLGNSNWLSSLEGDAPLYDFLGGHGFVVIQPTHLDSKFLNLTNFPPGDEFHWTWRTKDMVHILNNLEAIERAVPYVKGRLDKDRVAIVGHSFGGWTASMLLGATNTDPNSGKKTTALEKRIKAGVVLSGPGNGGSDMSEAGKLLVPSYGPDFSNMSMPALIVYGDEDISPEETVRGADWHADPYKLSPGPKSLFTVKGGKHSLGGVSGWDGKEAQDESPQRLIAVQRIMWAYLRSVLCDDLVAWEKAKKALSGLEQIGTIESKK